MELVVDEPDVLLGIVRAHLDLVRPAPASHLEELALVLVRPPFDHLAFAINNENGVMIAPLPPALRFRIARGVGPIVVAGRHARRSKHAVRSPGFRALW